MAPVIQFENVGKRYRVVRQRRFLARELALRLLARRTTTQFHWALHDLSFQVEAGESVGVIGANGSGKSTLLSLIARTSYPTTGKITVGGRVGPLLELGAGFHQDLTGRENIALNASLLGLSRAEVEERQESIIDYSGIRDFIDASIQTYSTGMKARLGFAVIAHIDPEILLIDEALSVGDGQFQHKCEATMQDLRQRGKTLFLVSHDLGSVQRMCERALWLHQGGLQMAGPSAQVAEAYSQFLHGDGMATQPSS
jgi:ABC-type polysaccharide/polyol phosphate transport system ATPase subunit